MKIFKKLQYNSPVVLTYTIISILILVLGVITRGASTTLLFSSYRSSFADPLFYVRLFTHVMGHVDFNHLFNNFLIILLVGPMLEEKYGSKSLLIMMVLTALITGLLHVLFFDTALLGASGIVFFMILLASYANFQKGRIPLTLILIILMFIGREIFDIVFLTDNISQLSHILGGIIGAVAGYFINDRNASKA